MTLLFGAVQHPPSGPSLTRQPFSLNSCTATCQLELGMSDRSVAVGLTSSRAAARYMTFAINRLL